MNQWGTGRGLMSLKIILGVQNWFMYDFLLLETMRS